MHRLLSSSTCLSCLFSALVQRINPTNSVRTWLVIPGPPVGLNYPYPRWLWKQPWSVPQPHPCLCKKSHSLTKQKLAVLFSAEKLSSSLLVQPHLSSVELQRSDSSGASFWAHCPTQWWHGFLWSWDVSDLLPLSAFQHPLITVRRTGNLGPRGQVVPKRHQGFWGAEVVLKFHSPLPGFALLWI